MAASTYEVSQNDLRELRRVFEWLADFAPKFKVERELKPKLERRAKLALFRKSAPFRARRRRVAWATTLTPARPAPLARRPRRG